MATSTPQGELLKATHFAAIKHSSQRRKDSTQTPYINHPIGVANNIIIYGAVNDVHILQAALLHDTVEDTDTTLDEIEKEFGPIVRGYVNEVTDNKDHSKEERKRQQILTAPKKTTGAKLVKLADKLYNLRDLLRDVPPSWTSERVQGYFVWSTKVVAGLRGTNKGLEDELDKVFKSSFTRNGVQLPVIPNTDLDAFLLSYYKSFESEQ